MTQWLATGYSVRGASHQESGLPNQDAITWRTGGAVVVAVADGHGSSRHFRSQRGSGFAVESLVDILSQFVQQLGPELELEEIETLARAQLPERLVELWRQRVNIDLEEDPVSVAEWERLISTSGASSRQMQERTPTLAYGSTALGAVVGEKFVLFLQLGDGDILGVEPDGRVKRAFERDRRFAPNQTTSLCLEDAASETRVTLWPLPGPVLLLLSTDGYANSFRTEEDFEQIGPAYLEFIRTQGLERLDEELPAALEDVTQNGSGDDVTLAVLFASEVDEVATEQKETGLP